LHLELTWVEIALRLCSTLVAAALIGINRSEHGRPAGLKTSLLVSLAACIAMLQVNFLLPLTGRHPDSFVMNDLMRLPLGILSGMGFIGAGAIVRRDDFVVGVTTAATLWFLTVMGLCFGGGQVAIGWVAAGVAFLILTAVKAVEDRMKQHNRGTLLIVTAASEPDEEDIRRTLRDSGFHISGCELDVTTNTGTKQYNCHVRWTAKPDETQIPPAINSLIARTGVIRVCWKPQVK
jgi:putative Mg2+ transporter-C (MgtC) family protein